MCAMHVVSEHERDAMTTTTASTSTSTSTKSRIVPLPFGELSLVAEQYRATGKVANALAAEGALLPMLSNAICGHATFSKLFTEKSVNKSHAVQAAVWDDLRTDKGTARNTKKAGMVREVFKLGQVVADQASHDSRISEARMLIADYFAPVVRATAERTDWKALAESLQAQLQACQIDLAECQLQLATATAPAPAPAMA